ncbi:MAG: hypothetical protein OEZ01_15770, partial [Candidatus Heimdallarchaeota archaeon]|nr:hypothetical protein [Candidatus Heimdallarchaeota archaeon]
MVKIPIKNYIICSLGPSNLGVGRLVNSLIEYNETNNYNYEFIYNPVPDLKNKLVSIIIRFSYLNDILRRIHLKLSIKSMQKKIKNIENSNVILIYPQSIGFENIIQLASNNNVAFYVVDNSFFCLKSYNHLSGEYASCLRCLGSQTFDESIDCKPFPMPYSRKKNIDLLKIWKTQSNEFSYLVQNQNQANLLQKHFDTELRVKVVNLYTNEFVQVEKKRDLEKEYEFDIAYHGSLLENKGIYYLIQLSAHLRNYTILIPYAKEEVLKQYPSLVHIIKLNSNIKFSDMTWESGLKQKIINSKIVVCPS